MSLRLSLLGTERTLSRSVFNARYGWSQRAACLLSLSSDHGVGWGEAAPLPGFSPDSLEDCRAALARLDPARLPPRLDPGHSVLGELSRASSRVPAHLPAARAALECALLDLWSQAADKPAWALLLESDAAQPRARPVAALLMGRPEQAVDQARRAQQRGIDTFKLKIGTPGLLEQEISAVRGLRTELGNRAKLRLDANRSLDGAHARDCLPRFAAHELELVEEPCPTHELASLAELELPLALDESLSTLRPQDVELQAGVAALVLKPTLLGGISACVAWANLASRIGAQVIVSHAFEGPLGLALSAALALSIGSETCAQGLDLEGARLEHLALPFFSGSHIEPWLAPGLGDLGQSR